MQTRCTLTILLGVVLAPLSAPAQSQAPIIGTSPKATPTPAKPAAKPEDWKTSAPDTTGLNFKGRKEITLRLATDAKGKIAKADIDKSSGDPALDKRVADWALKHWSGPPGAKTRIPIAVGQ